MVCAWLDGIHLVGSANGCAGGVGAAYQFSKDATANLRQKDDCYNEAVAGFVAGCGVGIYGAYPITTAIAMLTTISTKPSIYDRCRRRLFHRHDRFPIHQWHVGRQQSRDGFG